MGLDTISAGNALGFARSTGLLGSLQEAEGLLRDIAYNRSPFSKGVRFAAGQLGRGEYAIHVKGLELPAYNPAVPRAWRWPTPHPTGAAAT